MKLFIVPTPIGNLQDMTFRAINVLKSVDLILAEDTRVSGKLLKHFEINTKMQSYHMHNEHKILKSIVDKLKSGIEIALISDAGTPAISDPGFLLTRACVDEGIAIECLPGATAFVPALVNSGLPNDRFVFEGFLPIKKGRQTRLKLLAQETRTIVIYVSPHKLNKTLEEIVMYLGPDRQISVSRELSKIYEETLRGTAQSILEHYNSKQVKGEIVLIISGINQDKN
jgi:16S rRNA (cytidine1402-2'-O)-methyltransferase